VIDEVHKVEEAAEAAAKAAEAAAAETAEEAAKLAELTAKVSAAADAAADAAKEARPKEAAAKEEPAVELPKAKALELLETVDELFRKEEPVAEGPREAGAEPAAAEKLDAVIAEFSALEVAVADGGVVMLGGDVAVEEGVQVAESLSLDANWRGGDKGLAVLRDLPEIAMINIQGAKLTDEALTHVAALPKLRNITIRETKFSAAALRKLHRAKPEAYMYCQGSAMMGIHAETTGSCVLTGVYPGSGSADAGLQVGDKIVAIDDLDVRDFSELTIAVYARKAGEKLKIEFERDGKRQTVHVELRERKVLEP
jgi:hypothetical protein